MKDKNKKPEKKSSVGGIVAAVFIMLLGAFEGVDGDAGAFAGVILIVVVFFAVVAIIGAANKMKKNKPTASAVKTEKREKKSESYAQNKEEQKYYQSERKYYDSDCQAMSSDHDHNRRLEQLDGFLKNGIVSLQEYNILKSKYGG